MYRPGERWQRPARDMRIVLETARIVAVAFNVPVAEFLSGRELSRHPTLQALGPDLTDPEFDPAHVIAVSGSEIVKFTINALSSVVD